jgi:pimeloyl-ACP methyl ester carboxylesterase
MQLSVNGLETFVATGGREFDVSQPTIVLLHGAGFDHTTWALHSRWFAHHGYGVLAPDLPGHGRSAGAPLATIAEMADWTAALLDAAGAAKARLVGHSMGSLIALETAARHPAKVTALSLIGTAATMTVGPDLLKAAEANDHSAVDMVSIWGLGASVQRPLGLQFLSKCADCRRADQGPRDPHSRRTRHDDAGESRQGACRGAAEFAHRGAAWRRAYDDGRTARRVARGPARVIAAATILYAGRRQAGSGDRNDHSQTASDPR